MGFAEIVNYTCKNIPTEEGETAVIVAYLPGTACIMCAEVFHSFSRYYATFQVCGQLNGKGYPKDRLIEEEHDHFCESESEQGDFTRQFRLNNETIDLERQIEAAIAFFRKFLEKNRAKFAPKFLAMPFLPIAPVNTEEYNQAGQSLSRTGPQEYFEKKVIPLMPREIMPLEISQMIKV